MSSPDLAAHPGATGVLITDHAGRVLLVASPYRDALVQPGGMIEAGESPAAAAEREVAEELGLTVVVTRLLVAHHRPVALLPATMLFVFDTGPIDSRTPLTLQADEISGAYWLSPAEAVQRHTEAGRRRLAAALRAQADGTTIYLDADRELVG